MQILEGWSGVTSITLLMPKDYMCCQDVEYQMRLGGGVLYVHIIMCVCMFICNLLVTKIF